MRPIRLFWYALSRIGLLGGAAGSGRWTISRLV